MIPLPHLEVLMGRSLRADATEGLQDGLSRAGIQSIRQLGLFLGQVSVETGKLRWLVEIDNGRQYEGRRDLGNRFHGDGPKYRGRGCIQLTGRANYTEFGKTIASDVVNDPGLVGHFPLAWVAAGWFWHKHDLASVSSVAQLTKRVNGGSSQLSARIEETRRISLLAKTSPFWTDFFASDSST